LFNNYSEAQVQAIFLKSSDPYPQCDMKVKYGGCSGESGADAYAAETNLGHILRYLKCSTTNPDDGGCNTGFPRYPNLQQVFLTIRTYGGYAVNPTPPTTEPYAGCLSPEPYAYETGFAIQRIITAQIRQTVPITGPTDPYSGPLDYNTAPWVDWGPYLWADTTTAAANGLFWCDTINATDFNCLRTLDEGDFRFGDPSGGTFSQQFWGDHTHPNYQGEKKVANELLKFIQGGTPGITGPQHFISDWVTWTLTQ
jgi:hypothetical protein